MIFGLNDFSWHELQYDYDYGHTNSPHQNYSSQKHTPPKSNIDTTNDGWKMYDSFQTWLSLGYLCGFQGGKEPQDLDDIKLVKCFMALPSHWISITSHLYLHTALKGIKVGKPLSLSHWFQWHIHIILGLTTFQLGSPNCNLHFPLKVGHSLYMLIYVLRKRKNISYRIHVWYIYPHLP